MKLQPELELCAKVGQQVVVVVGSWWCWCLGPIGLNTQCGCVSSLTRFKSCCDAIPKGFVLSPINVVVVAVAVAVVVVGVVYTTRLQFAAVCSLL